MEKHTAASAPNDIELRRPREPLEYFVEVPSENVNADTGLIVFIPGWGMEPGSEYISNNLMPYLAKTYNCVVVSLRYQGIRVKYTDLGAQVLVPNGWFEGIHQTYRTPLVHDINAVLEMLSKSGIHEVSQKLPLHYKSGNDYLSFGFMPALDHICVLSEVMKNYSINKKRLYLFGTSYGGYIASLLTKLIPNTFAMAVDNSGFANTQISELNYAQSGLVNKNMLYVHGIHISMIPMPVWDTQNESHRCYFKPAYNKIRDLKIRAHWVNSKTNLFCFHYKDDPVASYADKRQFCETRKNVANTNLITINEKDLDGHVFKKLEHGFSASMKGLFQYVMDQWQEEFSEDDQTDFDRETQLMFDCGEFQYVFKYYKDYSYEIELNATSAP